MCKSTQMSSKLIADLKIYQKVFKISLQVLSQLKFEIKESQLKSAYTSLSLAFARYPPPRLPHVFRLESRNTYSCCEVFPRILSSKSQCICHMKSMYFLSIQSTSIFSFPKQKKISHGIKQEHAEKLTLVGKVKLAWSSSHKFSHPLDQFQLKSQIFYSFPTQLSFAFESIHSLVLRKNHKLTRGNVEDISKKIQELK